MVSSSGAALGAERAAVAAHAFDAGAHHTRLMQRERGGVTAYDERASGRQRYRY